MKLLKNKTFIGIVCIIIGLVIGVITLVWSIYYIYSLGGWEAYMEQTKDAWRQMGVEVE